jgi:hypothetical protein
VSRLLIQNDEQMPDDDEKTIYEFCQDGNEERVEQMLKRNFDVNKPDEMVKQQIFNILHFYLSN